MNFKEHSDLEGKHAFLSASKYHWLNYTEDKLRYSYINQLAVMRGTKLHEFAKMAITLGLKQPKSKRTINMYINDAIGYKMTPEQPLYYSENCFGTADAICFRNNILRIHDLKTGESKTSMKQLLVYAALFCLEYNLNPKNLTDIELRIYQLDEVFEYHPEVDEVLAVMDKIVTSDMIIEKLKLEV